MIVLVDECLGFVVPFRFFYINIRDTSLEEFIVYILPFGNDT